ncbi:hypothetical protein HMPREF1555_00534 [Porphyromonas gingivalis F0570]|uniref:Uncharacterized protein n=1 Tax=Porphyromonas gingivalis F0570 TaxID=1227271 RepID=A0A0E2M794_PORGN|nr:hypothetical protein HMPREF1555_00534 [Porphyromonas gingivalis F0570]
MPACCAKVSYNAKDQAKAISLICCQNMQRERERGKGSGYKKPALRKELSQGRRK